MFTLLNVKHCLISISRHGLHHNYKAFIALMFAQGSSSVKSCEKLRGRGMAQELLISPRLFENAEDAFELK